MSDRELLEAAAKAAGIVVHTIEDADGVVHWDNWNPLTDDGDALRLAVKLKMLVDADGEIYEVATATPKNTGVTEHAKHNGDPYAATRRAIVRAAAEIGRAK
jgi:hypothetical protein